jgi:hypothetical protein
MEQSAVEWLYENLIFNSMSNVDAVYNERVLQKAKEMEKEQRQKTIEEAFELLNKTTTLLT